MAGKYQRQRERPAWLGKALLAAAVIAAFVLGIAVTKIGSSGTDGAAGDSSGKSGCTERPLVIVRAAEEIAPVVRAAGDRVAKRGICGEISVQGGSSSDAAREIAQGFLPDVWIPDSSTWTDRANAGTSKEKWGDGPSLATTPVMVAASPGVVAKNAQRPSWPALLGGSQSIRMADPERDAASRLALFAATSARGQSTVDQLKAGAGAIFLSRSEAHGQLALLTNYAADPAKSPPFPASEQAIAAYNKAHSDKSLGGFVPMGGTTALDYPWIAASHLSPEASAVARAVQAELASDATATELKAAGFRREPTDPGPTFAGSSGGPFTALTELKPSARTAAITQWQSVKKDMRMLAVIDVSGSMKQPVNATTTRMQVAQGAASTALKILPAGSQIGGWAFSTDKAGPGKDWREMVPVRQLDAPVAGGTQRDALLKAVGSMPGLIGGDTGLYDTTLAAWRYMHSSYDPNYINSVVILTDGKNDDPRGGVSLAKLLETIRKEGDAERPVKVITIGIGENTDPAAAAAVAKATGGSSFVAKNAADIQKVFVEALLLR
ncbi:MAG: substrate-binding and VWA domain-containing protein [Micrococcales bacterium]|nr:substrate-binding and VWA domain-containing protein [Micrococcales bacterium]